LPLDHAARTYRFRHDYKTNRWPFQLYTNAPRTVVPALVCNTACPILIPCHSLSASGFKCSFSECLLWFLALTRSLHLDHALGVPFDICLHLCAQATSSMLKLAGCNLISAAASAAATRSLSTEATKRYSSSKKQSAQWAASNSCCPAIHPCQADVNAIYLFVCSYDAIVVGLGAHGSACLYHLARWGSKV
jgi:hypothetical protein